MSSLSGNLIIALLIVYAPLLIIAGNISAKGKQSGLCTLSQFLSCVVLVLLGQKETLPFCFGILLLIANILFLIRLARNAARPQRRSPATPLAWNKPPPPKPMNPRASDATGKWASQEWRP